MAAFDWVGSWTTLAGSQAIADASTHTTAAVSNDTKLAREISVACAYGATATEGIKVYILRDIDGTNYEAVVDNPWGFEMPKTVSTTHRRTFTVPGTISKFKVHITNDSGAQVTVDIREQAAVQ